MWVRQFPPVSIIFERIQHIQTLFPVLHSRVVPVTVLIMIARVLASNHMSVVTICKNNKKTHNTAFWFSDSMTNLDSIHLLFTLVCYYVSNIVFFFYKCLTIAHADCGDATYNFIWFYLVTQRQLEEKSRWGNYLSNHLSLSEARETHGMHQISASNQNVCSISFHIQRHEFPYKNQS